MRLPFLTILVLPLASAMVTAQRAVPSHEPSSPRPATATVPGVARVNGVAISKDRLDAAVSALVPQESFHRSVKPEKMAELRAKALATLIDEELAYQDGIRRGIAAADTDVRRSWADMARTYGGDAKFRAALQTAHVAEATVRQEMARRVVIGKSVDSAVTGRCAVGLEEAAAFFRDNPARFLEPEQVHVFGITIGVDPSGGAAAWRAARARADDADRALQAGRPFSEVAAEYSTDPSRSQGGDMGFVHRGSMNAPFEEIVKTLEVGRTSPVIESLYGYHILRLSEVRPPVRKTFEQVSATLRRDLTARRCAERKAAWLADLRSGARIETFEPTR
ncbi:MAG: peptidylprolyl isomerase [Vicinamibacterales bacterium]